MGFFDEMRVDHEKHSGSVLVDVYLPPRLGHFGYWGLGWKWGTCLLD